jgi:hypothetical protein
VRSQQAPPVQLGLPVLLEPLAQLTVEEVIVRLGLQLFQAEAFPARRPANKAKRIAAA